MEETPAMSIQDIAREDMSKCSICNREFRTAKALGAHMSGHRDVGFMCGEPGCRLIFHSYKEFNSHKSIHTKEFQCNLCDRIYYKSHALKTHIDSVHLKKTNYDCKECEKSFYMKRDLDNHINSHKGVKSYQCDVCNKSFGHVSNLNRHKRTHTKEKPYICSECGKRFTQSSTLVAHRRSHTAKLQCKICSKNFLRSLQLQRHLAKLHGIKISDCAEPVSRKFYCRYCGETYYLKLELTRHVMIKHQNESVDSVSSASKSESTDQLDSATKSSSASLQDSTMSVCLETINQSESTNHNSDSVNPIVFVDQAESFNPAKSNRLKSVIPTHVLPDIDQLGSLGLSEEVVNSNSLSDSVGPPESVILSDSVVEPYNPPVQRLEPNNPPMQRPDPYNPPVQRLEPYNPPVQRLEPYNPPLQRLELYPQVQRLEPHSPPVQRLEPYNPPVVQRVEPHNPTAQHLHQSSSLSLNSVIQSNPLYPLSVMLSVNPANLRQSTTNYHHNLINQTITQETADFLEPLALPKPKIFDSKHGGPGNLDTGTNLSLVMDSKSNLENESSSRHLEVESTGEGGTNNLARVLVPTSAINGPLGMIEINPDIFYVVTEDSSRLNITSHAPELSSDAEGLEMSSTETIVYFEDSSCSISNEDGVGTNKHNDYISHSSKSQSTNKTVVRKSVITSQMLHVKPGNSYKSKDEKKVDVIKHITKGSGEDENTHRAKVNSDIKDIIGKYTRQELCIEEEEDSLIKKPCLLPEAKPKVKGVNDLTEPESIRYLASLETKRKRKKEFKCVVCDKIFTSLNSLDCHKGEHDDESKQFKCEICDKLFGWKTTLKRHKQSVHSETKLVKCNQCDKQFKAESILRDHIRRDHENERNFSCLVCAKEFYKKSDLKVHLRVHTKTKLYSCEKCNKSFTHISHLKRHQKIHIKNPFSCTCTICFKHCNNEKDLNAHSVIHVGERKDSEVTILLSSLADKPSE